MKRYVLSHVPIALLYAVVVWAVKGNWWSGEWMRFLQWGWWVGGVMVGVLVLYLDRVVYTYSYPAEQLSQQFTWYWKAKKYGTALALLDARRLEQEKLTFRSALFMAMWVPLAIFTLTSTTGLFGKGVVMGLMLHVLYDAWRLHRTEPRRLHVRMFWLIKRVVSEEERLVFLWVLSAIFVLFSLWVG